MNKSTQLDSIATLFYYYENSTEVKLLRFKVCRASAKVVLGTGNTGIPRNKYLNCIDSTEILRKMSD